MLVVLVDLLDNHGDQRHRQPDRGGGHQQAGEGAGLGLGSHRCLALQVEGCKCYGRTPA